MKPAPIIILAMALAVHPARAEDEHRELGPHEHGHGKLNIAIEKTRVAMELEVPGMDIAGFEHAAESSEQKATIEKARKLLADPLALFKVPAGADCKVVDAKVEIEAGHEHADGGTAHDEKAPGKDETAPGKTASAEHDDHGGHEGHTGFHVTYALDCARPAGLTSIQFDYFKIFPGAEELDVSVVTDKGQNTYEVTRGKPMLDLGGVM